MRIGVVSDTHGKVPATLDAVAVLKGRAVELVIHCGDIGSPAVVALFDPLPTHFVLGNVDYDRKRLQAAITACGQTCHGRFGSLELEGLSIAFLHGDDEKRLRDAVGSQRWDLVCFGHTHVAHQSRVGKTLLLNPGAVFRARPRTVAIVDLPSLEVSTIPIRSDSGPAHGW